MKISENFVLLLMAIVIVTYLGTKLFENTNSLEAENRRLQQELQIEKIKSNSYQHGVKDSR